MFKDLLFCNLVVPLLVMQIIFGNRWRHLLGERDLWEHVGGIDVSMAPSSFGQANTRVDILFLILQCTCSYFLQLLSHGQMLSLVSTMCSTPCDKQYCKHVALLYSQPQLAD